MSEQIKVDPTPIQRNSFDVAIELLNLHVSKTDVASEDLSELFAQYYALANTLNRSSTSALRPFLPADIASKL